MDLYPNGDELVWRRFFSGRPDQAGRAREFVAYLLADLAAVDDAVLVAGEFVANALRHTASADTDGRFMIEVRRRPDRAAVALTDQGSFKEPRIPTLDNLSECGRGLYMARTLAADLTWTGNRTGRTFTATFVSEPG